MHREIKVVPYNPEWPRLFEQEAEQLRAMFGTEIISIEHIGSTSIPGLHAKPIIDVLVGVHHIEVIDSFNPMLLENGYIPEGEYGLDGRRFIIKGNRIHRSHHIHIFGKGHYRLVEHVIFRDYLIAHPAVAQQYYQLKMRLAAQYTYDSQKYVDGKASFIEEVNQKAALWHAQRQRVPTGVAHGMV